MSSFARGRSVTMVRVFMFLLLPAKKAMVVNQLHIVVRNGLEGNFDLTVSCNNIEPAHRLIHPDLVFEWIYTGGVSPNKPPFLCSFQWKGGPFHSFNLFDPLWEFDCYPTCHWYIKQTGPCRWYYGGNRSAYFCSKWN
ncbi:hypothetical protein Fmac_017887 [Flemingia macrophylla]|uniref:S-protein homolog n=1 Tax=Flemingia macrophylla TaxID=520843 RepID=A0ABD1M3H9_9FABA